MLDRQDMEDAMERALAPLCPRIVWLTTTTEGARMAVNPAHVETIGAGPFTYLTRIELASGRKLEVKGSLNDIIAALGFEQIGGDPKPLG